MLIKVKSFLPFKKKAGLFSYHFNRVFEPAFCTIRSLLSVIQTKMSLKWMDNYLKNSSPRQPYPSDGWFPTGAFIPSPNLDECCQMKDLDDERMA